MSKDQALKEQIISKVWEDETFKQQLLADPKAVMKESFGIEFPQAIEVNAVNETPTKFYLVIPPKPTEMKAKDPLNHPAWA